MGPAISVILPVYNAESTVGVAINSILNQTFGNFELLIINDGSTDQTEQVIRSFSDARIRHFKTQNRGIARALNFGIKLSKAPLIARMDADDISYAHRLEKQINFLNGNTEIGVVSSLVDYKDDNLKQSGYSLYVSQINTLLDHDILYRRRFQESGIAHPSVMFRKRLIEQYGGYSEEALPEDYELWLRLMQNGIKIGKIKEPLMLWNDLPTRLSRNSSNYSDNQFYRLKALYFKSYCLKKYGQEMPPLYIWGTGRLINKWSGFLSDLGFIIKGYIDVKKQDKTHSKFLHYTEIPLNDNTIVLSFVRDRIGKKQIEQYLTEKGYIEGTNFFMFS